jgi:DNA polymerase III subunit epsilon
MSLRNMNNIDFIALDVETANEHYWTICQIGLAYFKDDQLVDKFELLVNPKVEFSFINTSIHGITEQDVKNAMLLQDAYELMSHKLEGNIIAHHTHFDRSAFCRCADHNLKPYFDSLWVDTAIVARNTWNEVKHSGYGLYPLSQMLGISIENHHNALSDAIVAGHILIKAHQNQNIPIENFVKKYSRPLNRFVGESTDFNSWKPTVDSKLQNLAAADPNPAGPLFGEVIVFTGELTIPRVEAAEMAFNLGCDVDLGVTKNTTILVVGQQDLSQLAGHAKSSKHRKAEDLITKGQHIRIIGENDFKLIFSGL